MSTFSYNLSTDPLTDWRAKDTEAGRKRAMKGLAYLGPWCPDCGKRGKRCRNAETCFERRFARAMKGTEKVDAVALPTPPMDWLMAKGYASEAYHTGGRWRDGGRPKMHSWLKRGEVAREYAYELAMGRNLI